MFAVFRLKKVYFLLAILISFQLILTITLCLFTFGSTNASLIDFTVVIDAGHGGVDGGVVGANGSKESDLNLLYAKALGDAFLHRGFGVVYTRTNQGGLYGLPTKGFKMRDMNKRKQVIADSNAQLVLSIHMNTYSNPSRSGPQVFFQKGSNGGQLLANSIQHWDQVFVDHGQFGMLLQKAGSACLMMSTTPSTLPSVLSRSSWI